MAPPQLGNDQVYVFSLNDAAGSSALKYSWLRWAAWRKFGVVRRKYMPHALLLNFTPFLAAACARAYSTASC